MNSVELQQAFVTIDQALFNSNISIQSQKLYIDDTICSFLPWAKALKGISLSFDILRADKNHDQISGNKWYKLRGWLLEYFKIREESGIKDLPLVSFGGSHSNHLVALAAAAKLLHLPTALMVRSNNHGNDLSPTPTLETLEAQGSKVIGVSRSDFRKARHLQFGYETANEFLNKPHFAIPEGGGGHLGVLGIQSWIETLLPQLAGYQALITGVGTGATFAGLVLGLVDQPVDILGVPVVRGGHWLPKHIHTMLSVCSQTKPQWLNKGAWRLDQVFSKPGFQPIEPELVQYLANRLDCPMDPTYLPRAIQAMIWHYGHLSQRQPQRLLLMHNGGLQARGSVWPAEQFR